MERKHLTSLEQVEDLVKSNIFFEIMGSKVLVELVAWFAKAWGSPQRCIYVICESNRSAEIWRNSLLRTNMKWMGHDGASQAPSVPIFFPGFAFSDFRQSQISEDIWDARSVACCFLATNRAKIVTTTIEAMSQRTLGKAEWSKRTVRIEKGKEYSQDLLEGLLNELGFAQVSEIERIGDVSFNGGLVDLFTPENGPVRLVYFGDHVAEIFQIERGSLRNSDTLDSIVLSPPREVVFPNGCWSEQLQRLHDTLLNLDLTTAQRNLIFDNVSHRRRNQGCEYWNQLLNEHIGAAWDWVKDDDYLIFPDGLVRCRVAFEDRVSKVARGEYFRWRFSYESI